MSMIDECGMLVDELRDDPAFVESLTGLRDAITDAVLATDTRGVAGRYRAVAECLVEIVDRLESQR
ncbi:MAG: hypothetical protein EBS90_09980 [Betaproteobacteria bacterium]|nr:hypothetical protein [Betaproteobacteria bacterium]